MKDYLFSKRDLRKLIVPLVFEQTLAMTVGMMDTMMISSVGEAAVSGVSLVDMLNMLIFSLFSALATGGAIVTAQNIGAGKKEEACKSTNQLLYTVVIFSVLIMVLVLIFNRGLLRLFFGGIEDDVMRNAIVYLLISAVSFPFLAIYNACAALFRTMGNAAITLKVSLLMNIINVAGNAICIYGLKMGTAGVAIPTLISRVVAAIVLYILLWSAKNSVHFIKGRIHLDFSIIRKILYIGIPSSIENGIFQLGRVVVVSIIAGFGTVQIAANSVANSLDMLGCIIGQAVSLAMITVIGRCVGAQDEYQIRYYTRKLLKIAYIAAAILNASIVLLLPWILKLYGLSEETTKLAYILVVIHNGVAIFLWPTAFVLPNMLRSCNDVKFTMVVSIFSMVAFRIGFGVLLGIHFELGAIGIWIAMVIDWIFRFTLFTVRYFNGGWKKQVPV